MKIIIKLTILLFFITLTYSATCDTKGKSKMSEFGLFDTCNPLMITSSTDNIYNVNDKSFNFDHGGGKTIAEINILVDSHITCDPWTTITKFTINENVKVIIGKSFKPKGTMTFKAGSSLELDGHIHFAQGIVLDKTMCKLDYPPDRKSVV